MQLLKISLLAFIFTFGTLAPLMAQEDCLPKAGKQLVNDYTETLSANQVAELEKQLVQFNNETSNQIVVIITNELCNYEPMEYATNIGHSWGVGQEKFDNGVVMLVSPQHRETFIAVGYGLEGAIPDAIAKRIVSSELLPHFRNDDYYGGIQAATTVIAQLAKGEINAENYAQKTEKEFPAGALILIVALILIFFVVGPMLSARKYANTNDVAFWTAMMLIMSSRSSHGGSFGNFSSGSGSFGGGGGGGFGGFGGGGFGGGGAGGSW